MNQQPESNVVSPPAGAPLTAANASLAEPCTLRESVRRVLYDYFAEVDGEEVSNLYDLVLAEVEGPLLEVVLQMSGSNQSRAAQILGLNRGTLRKKLKQHNLL